MTTMGNSIKTVYILGAGFSAPAGGPNQAHILQNVFELSSTNEIEERRSRLQGFLESTLGIPKAWFNDLILEDVYTPIDRCIADGVAFRGMTPLELENVRADLDYLIAKAIQVAFLESDRDSTYVDDFARHLVEIASTKSALAQELRTAHEAKKHDPFAVISLNWDILLDNALDEALKRKDYSSDFGDYDPFGVVDYCCYVSSYSEDDRRIRTGLWSLGCRGYNVKLLKIHGSLNWLQCMNCQRLFTSFNEKLVVSEKIGKPCRHCSKHGMDATLRGTLIMPTFLKDLTNFQIKLVWQNAGVELMEARRLVFIGYSLPPADFEFRQLLSRMVHREAAIHVVLWGGDPTYPQQVQRYRTFFPQHSLTFEPLGVEEFVRGEIASC